MRFDQGDSVRVSKGTSTYKGLIISVYNEFGMGQANVRISKKIVVPCVFGNLSHSRIVLFEKTCL